MLPAARREFLVARELVRLGVPLQLEKATDALALTSGNLQLLELSALDRIGLKGPRARALLCAAGVGDRIERITLWRSALERLRLHYLGQSF